MSPQNLGKILILNDLRDFVNFHKRLNINTFKKSLFVMGKQRPCRFALVSFSPHSNLK